MTPRHWRLALPTLLALTALVTAGPAHALVKTVSAMLDGAQETPPVATIATGNGTFTIDTGPKTITYLIAFQGLSSAETGAHLHGPAARGVPAGVKIPLPLGNPISGTVPYNVADEADILAGKWYVNIHTANNPNGEIRGQLDLPPVPGANRGLLVALGALLVGGAGFALRRRATA